jgi:hypothetical protein
VTLGSHVPRTKRKALRLSMIALLGAFLWGGGCGSGSGASDAGVAADGGQGALCASNSNCAFGYYCQTSVGSCGASRGTCQGTLGSADCVTGADVCGCDGKTYLGTCPLRQASVSEAHDGACSVPFP